MPDIEPTLTAADRHGIHPAIAAHVLHHYGEGGYRPGRFVQLLIETMVAADPSNLARFRASFPQHTAAVYLARYETGGIATLREIAGALLGPTRKD